MTDKNNAVGDAACDAAGECEADECDARKRLERGGGMTTENAVRERTRERVRAIREGREPLICYHDPGGGCWPLTAWQIARVGEVDVADCGVLANYFALGNYCILHPEDHVAASYFALGNYCILHPEDHVAARELHAITNELSAARERVACEGRGDA